MKRLFTLLIMIWGLFPILNAQTALDPNLLVNSQITGPGVYTVEAGKFYAFDGRLDLTFDVTIQGPDDDWIMNQTNPPVIVQTPGDNGDRRQFMQIDEGGKFTLKNVILSGTHNNGEIGRVFINNANGSGLIVDNCVITDWEDFALRVQSNVSDTLSVTNCVFVNGTRVRYSQWGGFPVRLDAAPDITIFENNTIYNCSRLLTNGGPFFDGKIHMNHNTIVNQMVSAEEQRALESIIANNIYYNYHFLGHRTENHTSPDDNYATYFTGNNFFGEAKDHLDSVSLYQGQNLLYRPQEIIDWFDTNSGDSLSASLLWEFPDVDSFILMDDNYKIGANYAQIDPGFTLLADNASTITDYLSAHYHDNSLEWPDWRLEIPVSYDETTGFPSLSWPPAFDLTYSNSALQTAGSDGLPLGDLNWYPDKKADYVANRDTYITALRDSMVNAQVYYDPATMDSTPLITDLVSSTKELEDPTQLYSSGNYPNPFQGITTIKFGLAQQSKVTLSVYNLFGQRVFESTERALSTGSYQFNFDGSNLSSGIYLYKIIARGRDGRLYVTSQKMVKSK